MKKHLFITVLVLVVTGLICTAQTFQKTYGASSGEFAYCIQQTNDGGFIVAGQTASFNPNLYYDVYLIKLNNIGNISWTKTISAGTYTIVTRYVEQNSDSGFIVCGKADNSGLLVRTDAAGNILWSKTINGFTFINTNEVHQTSDGGFIVIGAASPLTGPDNVLLLKMDASGNIIWQKIFSSTANNYEDAYSVRQTNDGGYIITGSSINPNVSSAMLLVKMDATGSVLWTKSYDAPGTYNIGWSVRQTADSGYIIGGQTVTTPGFNYDAYMIKTDSAGDTLWTRAFGGANPDYARTVQQTSDGGYMLAGYTQTFGAGGADGYLLKTDSVGNLSWSKAYGGTTVEITYFGMQTNDGGYIAAGSTTSFGSGSADVYLIKTDASGNSGCNEVNAGTVVSVPPCITGTATFTFLPGVTANSVTLSSGSGGTMTIPCFATAINEMVTDESAIAIYPNPSAADFTIASADFIQSGEVEIFTMQGKKIYGNKIIDAAEINVPVKNIIPGIYFLKLSNGEKTFTQKIIIQ
jgi:hypothetical protein